MKFAVELFDSKWRSKRREISGGIPSWDSYRTCSHEPTRADTDSPRTPYSAAQSDTAPSRLISRSSEDQLRDYNESWRESSRAARGKDRGEEPPSQPSKHTLTWQFVAGSGPLTSARLSTSGIRGHRRPPHAWLRMSQDQPRSYRRDDLARCRHLAVTPTEVVPGWSWSKLRQSRTARPIC